VRIDAAVVRTFEGEDGFRFLDGCELGPGGALVPLLDTGVVRHQFACPDRVLWKDGDHEAAVRAIAGTTDHGPRTDRART
jgi:hypothetical protein